MSNYGSSPGQPGHNRPPIVPSRPAPQPVQEDETSSMALIDDAEASSVHHKIKAIVGGDSVRRDEYKRTAYKDGKGACRVRSFHGRLSAQGLEYMDNQINEWLDSHPEVEVKMVTSTVGVFEGKIREPALVLNLWY